MATLREETIGEDDYSIEDMGYDARIKGIHQIDNPYAVNNWKHYDWEKGWLLADEEIQQPEEG